MTKTITEYKGTETILLAEYREATCEYFTQGESYEIKWFGNSFYAFDELNKKGEGIVFNHRVGSYSDLEWFEEHFTFLGEKEDLKEKQYFTIGEALSDIRDALLNGYDSYMCDLHNEVFNTGHYIIGTHEAKQALEQYGVFKAIEKVVEYEIEQFGSCITKIHDPEKLANMLYYIVGEDAIQELIVECSTFSENWNEEVDTIDTKIIIDSLDELLKNN